MANMVLHAEAHVNWIADAIAYLDSHGYAAIEATSEAVDSWIAECNQRAEATLFPKANSWYMGANVPGKPRVFMLFIGGFATYLDICTEVAGAGYKGFRLQKGGASGLQERDESALAEQPSVLSLDTPADSRG